MPELVRGEVVGRGQNNGMKNSNNVNNSNGKRRVKKEETEENN